MVQSLSRLSPSPLPDLALQVDDLVKVYSGRGAPKRALDGVSLSVPRGSFFGLLGPNGAGKSTLINILAGLVVKTSGRAVVWDRDIDRDPRGAKAAIGVVPQELNLDPFFTPRELLDVQSGMYGVPRSERRVMEILEAVGLADKADAYARTLSGGMRRRLLVAKAMVHSPPILVLDEPTAGVDIELRRQLWETVRELNARGVTILLTTHYLEEAEQLCDRIAIINHGKLVACDSTSNLLKRIDGKVLTVTVDRDLTECPAALAPFSPELRPGGQVVIRYRPSATPMARILAAFSEAGLVIADLSTEETDLEDIFLQLTSSRIDS
ncbi:multidrug ABC transporter ATP-binding protein [Paramagnetospirillum marisnigri]|uniref:Multidrug ABC transporter ATP-binding protein n=1 Tax=Paramagnetospirillum marisnigri TaxID=1285242 RepID=A0A178MS80_9PROT|nr:ABC transporter ATP-binding protein [Paramagnetospirillum marisnigri]OAN52359.1 multidrug ABC transporter ATP-binding protein [Paramagnetospirillum marisnigri]